MIPLAEKMQGLVRKTQTIVVFATLLGLAMHLDPSAANPLAPKYFWFAMACAMFAAGAVICPKSHSACWRPSPWRFFFLLCV